MDTAIQIMMGIGLAASAGLRAWLPLLVTSILARSGFLPLNPAFTFLARTDVLVVLAVATIVELLADKIIGLDHLLDAIGTVVRPVCGTVLVASVMAEADPWIATLLGIVAGGGTALSVHGAKAVVRAKTSVLAPVHAGVGNAGLSTVEDILSGLGAWFALHAPIIVFLIALLALIGAAWVIVKSVAATRRLLRSGGEKGRKGKME